MNRSDLGNKLHNLLDLQYPAVAIAFMDKPPSGVAQVKSPEPASCSYWKLASDGETFYTTTEHHQNCTIGAYTHAVKLTPDKSEELRATLTQMISSNYLEEQEIPWISHRSEPFEVAAYSPLRESPFDPQVVLIRGNAKHLMLLTEAAGRAGVGGESIMMRPTCAVLPHAIQTEHATPSFGCVGNRVYTGLDDNELYYAIPGSQLERVVAELEKIVSANNKLQEFHKARAAGTAQVGSPTNQELAAAVD